MTKRRKRGMLETATEVERHIRANPKDGTVLLSALERDIYREVVEAVGFDPANPNADS